MLNEDAREALLDALEDRETVVDENPWEMTDAVDEEFQPEPTTPDASLELTENFVDVLAELPDVNHNQRKIAYLIARNKASAAIAAQCGVSASYVKQLRADPRIKKLVEIFRGGAVYDLIERLSPREILDLAAVRAAEVLAEKMNAALSEELQFRAALEVLKLTGHGGKEGEGAIQINISPETFEVYREARREAGIETVEAEVVEDLDTTPENR